MPATIREAIGLPAGTELEVQLGPVDRFVARKATKESHFAKFRRITSKRGSGSGPRGVNPDEFNFCRRP